MKRVAFDGSGGEKEKELEEGAAFFRLRRRPHLLSFFVPVRPWFSMASTTHVQYKSEPAHLCSSLSPPPFHSPLFFCRLLLSLGEKEREPRGGERGRGVGSTEKNSFWGWRRVGRERGGGGGGGGDRKGEEEKVGP